MGFGVETGEGPIDLLLLPLIHDVGLQTVGTKDSQACRSFVYMFCVSYVYFYMFAPLLKMFRRRDEERRTNFIHY